MAIIEKSATAYRTISEVADDVGVPQHVLRFWETKFAAVKPLKRSGNRRYYRPEDVALLKTIRILLHDEGFTIKGVQKRFKEQGLRATVDRYMAALTVPDRTEDPLHASATPPPQSADGAPAPCPTADHNALNMLLSELRTIRQTLVSATAD